MLPTRARTCQEGPFGEVLRATGPMAKANPFRFSTKYQDDETDLPYYGYRYYNASTGRWFNRDPIQEQAGPSLYAFVGNDSVCDIDPLGLASLRFKVIVGIWSGFSGTWSQPYWAGSGDYETGDSFAWSLVNINNEAFWLDHLWYCAAYCNSVNIWGGVASAGTSLNLTRQPRHAPCQQFYERWNGFSAANPSRSEGKLTYVC